jgi:eukaryotic-like serine/threonine-protein kinase
MIGETISHYRILKQLGRGGMGVVYEAQDITLGRFVAIKFLPRISDQFSDAAKRLQREARTLSAVNHPNICTLYELGEHDGQPYLVEELLVGATFKEIIERRRLEPEFVLELSVQIADGLKAAHARGVVHRDLKPANLFLTEENRAKILDFGLALQKPDSALSSPEDLTLDLNQDQITAPGRIVGTLDYMSPEQLRGEPATPSSDIFCLGMVLYELLHGTHPFKKKSPLETASAILTATPEGSMSREMVASGLNMVLARMLAKNAENRYADGGALLAELQRVNSRAPGKGFVDTATWPAESRKPSIAVLPFVNLSADVENEYFCDGLAEELIGALAKAVGLQVAAWSSALRFRGKDADIREVGKKLGVQTVLEGSLRTSGSRLRVNVRLLDAENGYHLWAERYDRELQDVFAIQEEIAGAIVKQLRVKLGLDQPLVKPTTKNPEAYNLYLKGRYFWNRRGPAEIQKAVESFQQALHKDESFAPALAGLADCYVVQGVQGARNPKEVFPLAREAAKKALAIDPQMAEGFASMGCVEGVYEWNWAAAEERFQNAIDLNPRYGTAHHWYATHLLLPLGRFGEARTQLDMARANDPLSLPIVTTVGLIAYFERDLDRAIGEYEKALEMDANFALAHYFLGQAYEQKGLQKEAVRSLTRALDLAPGSSEMEAALARTQALAGDFESAGQMLHNLREKSQGNYVSPVLLSQVLLGLNRSEDAIAELQRAAEMRATDLIWLKVRPTFDGVRDDSRVREIVRAVGLL